MTPLRVKLLRVFSFLASVAVAGFLFMQISYRYFPSANEQRLRNENNRIKDNYTLLSAEIKRMNQELREIEKRDNQVYRSIFEASPLPDSARAKLLEQQAEERLIASLSEDELNSTILQQINTLRSRIYAQNISFNAIDGMIKNKEALLAATPAIQPVSNKELSRLASGLVIVLILFIKQQSFMQASTLLHHKARLFMQLLMALLHWPAILPMVMVTT